MAEITGHQRGARVTVHPPTLSHPRLLPTIAWPVSCFYPCSYSYPGDPKPEHGPSLLSGLKGSLSYQRKAHSSRSAHSSPEALPGLAPVTSPFSCPAPLPFIRSRPAGWPLSSLKPAGPPLYLMASVLAIVIAWDTLPLASPGLTASSTSSLGSNGIFCMRPSLTILFKMAAHHLSCVLYISPILFTVCHTPLAYTRAMRERLWSGLFTVGYQEPEIVSTT